MAAQVQTENLNFKAFRSSSAAQPAAVTPPSSGRSTTISGSSGDSSGGGGSTTRRSFLFNSASLSYNGNYEGDYSMFDAITKMTLNATPRQPKQKILEQLFDSDFNLNLEQSAGCDEADIECKMERSDAEELPKKTESDAELAEKQAGDEIESNEDAGAGGDGDGKPENICLIKRCWQSCKLKILSPLQCERMEGYFASIQEHHVYRKLRTGVKFLLAMLVLLLNYVLFGVIVSGFNRTCNAWRTRNALRNCARSMLWYMTLAKYGDLRLFAVIALLTPVTFVIGILGFFAALYCHVKEWIYRITGYIRMHMLVNEND